MNKTIEQCLGKRMQLNCSYSAFGCSGPRNCETCGFDRDETERRRKIPLRRGKDGLMRKYILRPKAEAPEPDELLCKGTTIEGETTNA